jgi:hypothetical protein
LDLPWHPLKEDRINGEKDTIIPRLAGSKKENFTLREEKRRPGKTSVYHPKKQKGENLTLLDGKRNGLEG